MRDVMKTWSADARHFGVGEVHAQDEIPSDLM